MVGDVVENEDMIKGYAIGKDQYVTVEDDELEQIAIESTRTVDIERFVPKASIDDRYRDTPYYLAPEDRVRRHSRRHEPPYPLLWPSRPWPLSPGV
jgi:DNA end-binding protein Ku